jgi:seryl-tRNA synthetase
VIGVKLSKKTEQLERELEGLKYEINQLSSKKKKVLDENIVSSLMKQLVEERERSNKLLESLTEKITKLEKEIDVRDGKEQLEGEIQEYDAVSNREVPLSELDSKILNFVQSKEMICADDLVHFMEYKGRNAACARLNKLYRQGILDRYQLGHKVYYKFDAGKTTNTLIISPSQ